MELPLTGLDKLARALGDLRTQSRTLAREALFMCAQHCKAVAAAYAPRSPTMANHSAALKRKKRTTAHRYPGSLEKSIECESSADRASVFVRQNALCVSATGYNYAKRIHDERGKSWRNLGAGSIAKGGKVGEKFIERAISDSADWCERVLSGRLRKIEL